VDMVIEIPRDSGDGDDVVDRGHTETRSTRESLLILVL